MEGLNDVLRLVQVGNAIPPQDLILVLNDLESRRIALTGSHGYPVVSPAFVAQVRKKHRLDNNAFEEEVNLDSFIKCIS